MADTVQIVQWTLEMRCQLRDDQASVKCPGKAAASVSSARAYSKALREGNDGFGNYGDVYVSSYTFGTRPGSRRSEESPYYPVSGFVISEEFERFGGTENLFEMCSNCPANARSHELARCIGTVPQWPASPETEEQLRGIISRLGLESAVKDAFPDTTPLWYGLWAVSPVPQGSLDALGTLLSEMLTEDRAEMEAKGTVDRDHIEEFSAFLSAIEIASTKKLNLHVNLLPLGHTDFGVYTIFPHCPFCKATAKVERWQRKYPAGNCTCHVCGTRFSPDETASSEKMDWDRDELRDKFDQERFEEFAKSYLIANGETPNDAVAIVQATEAKALRRQEVNRRNQELERLRSIYLERHVYVGLEALPSPPSDLDDDEEESEQELCTGWFDAGNLSTVLERCAEQGIKITMMQHRSSNPDLDRYEMRNLKSPMSILFKWQEEGCNESFHVVCRVPDSLVE